VRLIVLCFLVSLILLSRAKADSKMSSLSLCDLGDLSGWEGLTADQSIAYRDMPAPKWEHAKFPVARTVITARLAECWAQEFTWIIHVILSAAKNLGPHAQDPSLRSG